MMNGRRTSPNTWVVNECWVKRPTTHLRWMRSSDVSLTRFLECVAGWSLMLLHDEVIVSSLVVLLEMSSLSSHNAMHATTTAASQNRMSQK